MKQTLSSSRTGQWPEPEGHPTEDRETLFLEALPDMIFRLDRHGTYRDFKPAKGLEPYVPPDEFLGKTVRDVLPGPVGDKALSYIARALDAGETQTYEYTLPMADGLHDYEARIIPLGPNDVLAVVRDVTNQRPLPDRPRSTPIGRYGLTPRELEVLRLVTVGLTDKEIAKRLKISVETARKHVAKVRRKMGAASRTEAGVKAVREGLVT